MDQQALFNIYVFGVTIIAQSILAWELGTKGWDIALPLCANNGETPTPF
jgi:hypothetical protein